jgi:hypothetical protein
MWNKQGFKGWIIQHGVLFVKDHFWGSGVRFLEWNWEWLWIWIGMGKGMENVGTHLFWDNGGDD